MFAIKAEVSDPEAETFAFNKKGFAFQSYLVNPVNPVY
jgi:hypothetical protein